MKALITVLLISASMACFAQTQISGSVKDEKESPIPGANVLLQNTYDGTSTAHDGTFTFNTGEKGAKTLLITFTGYKPFSLQIELSGKSLAIQVILWEEINELEAVTISAGSFTAGEEKRRTILKAVDIATTAGATADIAGALNTLPGTQKVGESGRLFVRGGDSNETRTFIDGMIVLDAYGQAAPNTPSRGRFLPFMFKGTSFSTGGYSAEYGQALSSALVLNSKDKAGITQTDIGLLSVGADVAHTQVWDRSSLSAKIQYTDIRPYFGLVNQRVDWNTPPVSAEAHAAYRRQIGKDGMLKVYGNFNNSRFSLYNHDIQHPDQKQFYELNNNYRYGNATYLQSLNDSWTLKGGLSYTMSGNKMKIDGSPLSETERGVHAKLVAEHNISDNVELRVGSEIIARDYAASKQDTVSIQTLTQSFQEKLVATFAEAEVYASNHFVSKAGARMEYDGLINKASIDPRLSLAYKPGNKGQFAFAYGRFRQSAKNQFLRVDHLLNPEQAEHFILNYQIIKNSMTFRIETYYKKYDRLVTYLDADGTLFNNAGSGYAKGLELFWRDNKTVRNSDYWISYSFLDTKRNYLNFPVSAIPSFASKHNFSAVYKHFITQLKAQLGLTYSYSSGRPYNNPNTESFNGSKTPFYQDLSANIAYLPKPSLIVYLSFTNLLGRDNIFGYQYSPTPDAEGVYASRAIRQAAKRFLFIGVFITISKNKSMNQLPNL